MKQIRKGKIIIEIDDKWIEQLINESEEKNLNGITFNYPIDNDTTYLVTVGVKKL